MKRRLFIAGWGLALVMAVLAHGAEPVTVVLATTTSTQDTGLLDVLIPAFEGANPGIKLKPIAVGTGEALAMGRRGDADVLLVHAREAEEAFLAQGHGILRLDVMHNDFLVVGPPTDPAGVRGKPILEALQRIAAEKSAFVSRGDRSGTHVKELSLWKQAGIEPAGERWYVEVGQGMGAAARIGSEKRAYILIDRGTFLALQKTLDLVAISEGGDELRNRYGVIVVSPTSHPGVRAREARLFAEWLVSPDGQRLIGEFGIERFGQPLFHPAHPRD